MRILKNLQRSLKSKNKKFWKNMEYITWKNKGLNKEKGKDKLRNNKRGKKN